jgi:hypothetical protein
MKIGLVCEGQTDYITMVSFLSAELSRLGHSAEFDLIQPALDNSLPSGWTQVFYWLEQNPLKNRNALYRRGNSLFSIDDEDDKFDILAFQIDTDIIGEDSFERFIEKRGITPIRPSSAICRGKFIRNLICQFSGHSSVGSALESKDIPIALVESCETWVVAAAADCDDAESLSPEELCNRFGEVVAAQSNQPPQSSYASINKTMKTRRRVCSSLSKSASPAGKAPHFDQTVDELGKAICSK